ncbi:MAG TPA: hypothetical protein DDX19_17620 [Rhodopirellula baltica]|uniref:Uncharacterized protein n=1 Tax=Rhodopirellula baltica (strain DSM 10527 / NCIMB 13988 / SH1) TaxID=243090 RepID=Q7ULQ9_RHOBA|nr:hypothetical protein RB9347 [Rhodopirellula baltica SH 1]HBE64523.1 hypothetical protein [Rhodopirellula baltica]
MADIRNLDGQECPYYMRQNLVDDSIDKPQRKRAANGLAKRGFAGGRWGVGGGEAERQRGGEVIEKVKL